jgi:hypothetical protein
MRGNSVAMDPDASLSPSCPSWQSPLVPLLAIVLAALIVATFFIGMSWRAVYVHLSSDEMMNIYWYWEPGAWRVIWANLLFWRKLMRPMGGLYYLPLFHLFGFNPWPYTVVRLTLLLVDSLLLLRLAARLTGSLPAAMLAVLLVVYHPDLASLTHNGSFIYDVLCAAFYFGALLYYIHCRDSGRRLTVRQGCAFLALYICALDSKEMAVSLPVVICAYELLEASRGAANIGGMRRRFLAHGWPVAGAVIITAVYIVFKTYGSNGVAQIEAYRPVFSWKRFCESNQRFLNAIFYTRLFRTSSVLAAWSLILYLGLRNPDRRLLLLLVWVVVTPLPLAFIPPHGSGCIYIVIAGWGMIAAMACETLARRIAREPALARLPERAVVTCILAAALLYYVDRTASLHSRAVSGYFHNGEKTWNQIEQVRAFPLHPPHGSRIALLNDPFPEGWDELFIVKLGWNDRSLQVFLQNQQHLAASELDRMDLVFDFPNGRLTRINVPAEGRATRLPHSAHD